ncbi:MAG: hypothetical protein ACREAF_00615 [Nitrosopumilaceae archaeon]
MGDKYNSQIEKIAQMILQDKTSLDEQDQNKLQRYHDFAKKNFKLSQEDAIQIVNETFLYLKLKSAENIDPLQEADKFGAGFS